LTQGADMNADTSPFVPPEDEDIKRLARKDRAAALAAVVERHRPRLLRHAGGIVRDPDLAADIVQEVFIKSMREERLFDADFRIGAWLYRVTSNLALNNVRDSRRRGDILNSMSLRSDVDARQDEVVQDEQREKQIATALSRLSANHRKILHERFYKDLSYGEIASALDIKLGTVMSRLSRAKTALMELIDSGSFIELS
jgi:RNA polymerase sigma-70 factor (ECF subfamily)